jgi:FMN-dependent NADH-azoreductase
MYENIMNSHRQAKRYVMSKILHIDASSRSSSSLTRKLSKELVEALKKSNPGSVVTYRDLITEQPPFIQETDIGAIYTPPDARTPEQQKAFASIDKNLEIFISSDIYVFGVPMYNFSVPASFKSFIDLTVIAGKTFSYESGVPKGLLKNKKAYVLTASGGNYDGPPMSQMNFHEPYLRTIFGFIGITDMTFIKVQGHSEEEISAELAAARATIETIAAKGLTATAV